MYGWYVEEKETLLWLLRWAIELDLFRLISAAMYVIFAAGLWSLGAQYQQAIVRNEERPGQFPEGYFTMLAVQLVPLTITGFVVRDTYIIATRLGTLVMVLVVYGMISSKDGTYATPRYRRRMLLLLSIAIMGPMVWISSPMLQTFVRDWESVIAYLSVGVMVLFLLYGQRIAAIVLFQHFLAGNYTIKRFTLQWVRFFGFLFQSAHYGLAPIVVGGSFGWRDPIFLQGLIGTFGVAVVLVAALAGLIIGTSARWAKRRRDAQRMQST